MKRIFILLLMSSLTVLGEPQTYSFTQGTNTFSMAVNLRPVRTSMGSRREVHYQVFRNSTQLFSRDGEGRFLVCGQDPLEVRPLGDGDRQTGWIILGGGICGNTLSDRAEVVAVDAADDELLTKGFICKVPPVVKPTRRGFDIWFYQQNWGNGGTSTSIFVPEKWTLVLDEYEGFYRVNLLEGIETLSEFEPDWLKPKFINLFVAGIRDANPELMEYALRKYYHPEEIEWYEVYVADGHKEHLEKLIERTKELRALFDEVESSMDWNFCTKPFGE